MSAATVMTGIIRVMTFPPLDNRDAIWDAYPRRQGTWCRRPIRWLVLMYGGACGTF